MSTSFIRNYLEYTSDSEMPACFNRWSAISAVGAILERNVWIEFGHTDIYANMFCMLIGSSGTRKSTAIKLMKRTMLSAGYKTIAADKTTKEKFLLDFMGEGDADSDLDPRGDILNQNLFGESLPADRVSPMWVASDEGNEFFGLSNMEFLSTLGSFWDWNEPPFKSRIKNGMSVEIPNPTLSILAGNTPTSFSIAFPPEILGQGFFSRLLLIYGEPNGKKIAFPTPPDKKATEEIKNFLQSIKYQSNGLYDYTPTAKNLLKSIYLLPHTLNDVRFESYFNRRFTHLLKLCLVIACCKLEKVINEATVIEANTYLSYVEGLMPKALGEFGKSKNSDVTHKVLSFIESNDGVSLKDILKVVSSDLDKSSDLGDILRKLSQADKIQHAGALFLPMRKIGLKNVEGSIDLSFLTAEELAVKG